MGKGDGMGSRGQSARGRAPARQRRHGATWNWIARTWEKKSKFCILLLVCFACIVIGLPMIIVGAPERVPLIAVGSVFVGCAVLGLIVFAITSSRIVRMGLERARANRSNNAEEVNRAHTSTGTTGNGSEQRFSDVSQGTDNVNPNDWAPPPYPEATGVPHQNPVRPAAPVATVSETVHDGTRVPSRQDPSSPQHPSTANAPPHLEDEPGPPSYDVVMQPDSGYVYPEGARGGGDAGQKTVSAPSDIAINI